MESLTALFVLCFLMYVFKDSSKNKKKKPKQKTQKNTGKVLKYDPKTKSFRDFDDTTDNDLLHHRYAPNRNTEAKAAPLQQSASTSTPTQSEIKDIYYAKDLLTANELKAYAKLKLQADAKGWVICPKVRLADLVHPYPNDPLFMSHFGRIKSKHVDFVICNQLMIVMGIIELDDYTHDRKDRQARDRFVDDVLSGVGYKIIHTREITPQLLDCFAID